MTLARFREPVRDWFARTFGDPTEVQRRGWPRIASGEHALLLAPTGSGKTLAAFLWCIDRLSKPQEEDRRGAEARGVRVLYVSPLKALAYDIERNLRAPLAGIAAVADAEGAPLSPVAIDVRTGDTPARVRRRQARHPGDILITTPESLFLLLGSRARETLRSVETVIVDEVHAIAGQKRGAHLALSLERLAALTGRDPQRIGLSATVRPTDEVARFLGGDREVSIVDASAPPRLELEIVVPVAEMESLSQTQEGESEKGIWPAVYPRLLELIRAHRSTILFANSRRLAERLAQALCELAGEELVRAHHGSVARHQRQELESMLAAGEIPALVATSTLELGIDIGAVDLVVQIESPGSATRGLQRIGRAGHAVGAPSQGRIFPKFRGDLLEAAAVSEKMLAGEVEAIRAPQSPLDVLAQHVVSMVAVEPWQVERLLALVTRAYPFHELSREALTSVLDMLAGRYPSDRFADLRPRVSWDRAEDRLTPRRGAGMIALTNAGTIPDRGLYAVHLGDGGPKLGELDEEMVYESRAGETFLLGASTWRIEEITRDRVIVSPAPGQPGKMPFWRGEGPGRPIELGRAVGELVRRIADLEPSDARAWLEQSCRLDRLAAENLIRYVEEQRESTGTLPTDEALTVERFRDELGDWRLCVLSPFGGRVHAPWVMALSATLRRRLGGDVQALWSDDGIVLRLAEMDEPPPLEDLFPDPDEIEGLVIGELASSALFASRFRECAARALLLPRRRPGSRTPLYAQRIRAQNLLQVASSFESFPIVLEAYRECLRDVFDMPALVDLLRGIQSGDVRVQSVETGRPSPFSRSLVFEYVANYLYEGDAPLAERKAQALTVDRGLLRELIGGEALRDLLHPEAIAEVEAELSRTAPGWRARDADEIEDLLRRQGDLSAAELGERAEIDPEPAAEALVAQGRAAWIEIAGEPRLVSADDADRYRAGLAPEERDVAALESILLRFARRRGPFSPEEAAGRYGLSPAEARALSSSMEARELLVAGEISPGRSGGELCHPEVLRSLKRRTLARLRREVEPVPAEALGRFLPRWHGTHRPGRGPGALAEAVEKLEGIALPISELETRILPARVKDFSPRMLDELGASGQIAWVGRGALGARDAKIMLVTRARAPALVEAPGELPEGELCRALLDHLRERGASFFSDLLEACPGADTPAVSSALWELVWAGAITNDTFQPLRGWRSAARTSRGRKRNPAASGRWSLVEELTRDGASGTHRAHTLAELLLTRHGIVSREAALAEGLPGGFAPVGQVLRAMEEAGAVRRGYFVDGLSGMQFARAGVVDRLRDRAGGDDLQVLAAVDPANPYGALLPWPEPTQEAARPGRRAGAALILVGGAPALFVEAGGKRLVTFRGADPGARERAVREGLKALLAGKRRRSLRLERIDGEPARTSPLEPELRRAGFRSEHRGLVLELD